MIEATPTPLSTWNDGIASDTENGNVISTNGSEMLMFFFFFEKRKKFMPLLDQNHLQGKWCIIWEKARRYPFPCAP